MPPQVAQGVGSAAREPPVNNLIAVGALVWAMGTYLAAMYRCSSSTGAAIGGRARGTGPGQGLFAA
jgi:hypothetical protein